MVFTCPIEDCQYESCRKCGRASHIPYRCEEIEAKEHEEERKKKIHTDHKDQGRKKVEEAISDAKIRHCPKCSTAFIKSDGCNKMKCPCGILMCYICRKELDKHDPYSHFCRAPHCDHKSCNTCRLYTNNEEDDKLAMKEAGVTALTEFNNQLRQDDDNDGDNVGIKINVNKILGEAGGDDDERAGP